MKRLRRLEGSMHPTQGHMHLIYARDLEDFEAQRADLIASGAAAASDTFEDWNCGRPADQHEAWEPESFPITRTHEEWVDILAQQERTQ